MTKKCFQNLVLILAAFSLPVLQFWVMMPSALAISPNVVISEVATESANASQEFIELYNNSATDVSIEGWVVQMRSSNNALNRSVSLSETLKGHGYVLLASTNHPEACPVADFACFSSTMASTGGHVVLVDANGQVVDKLGWGPAVDPEDIAAGLPTSTMGLSRKAVTDSAVLQDTDHNALDFQLSEHTPTGGGAYTPEPEPEPEPEPTPTCQGVVISEILPNPAGDDTGQEFVELYNQTSSSVDLTGCLLKVGTAELVLTGAIEPLSYRAFYGLTLPNSAGGQVTFVTPTATTSVTYPGNLGDDKAYGLVDGTWHEGLIPSPNAASVVVVATTEEEGEEELEPCPAGKYRHPETNRCRNIETETGLAPCDPGQVRNPDTNRCRSAATATTGLAPCDPGQTRNPETNRCRKDTAGGEGLAACKEGQERNPETNRCRNVASAKSTNPMAQPAKASSKPVSYYVLGIVALLGLAYAAYEYRHSISNLFKRKGQKV